MPFPIAAAIAGGAALLSAGGGMAAQNKTNKMNMRIAKYSYKKDREMWELNNAYNDPKAQMARLEAAGLNPNLVYGNGTVAGNSSSSIPKYQAPHVQYQAPDIGGVVQAYQSTRIQEAQLDNLKAQEENTRARTITEASNAALKAIGVTRAKENVRHESVMHPHQESVAKTKVTQSEADLQSTWNKLLLMQQDLILKNLEEDARKKKLTGIDLQNEKLSADIMFKKYENELRSAGVNSSDHPIMRMLIRAIKSGNMQFNSEKMSRDLNPK